METKFISSLDKVQYNIYYKFIILYYYNMLKREENMFYLLDKYLN